MVNSVSVWGTRDTRGTRGTRGVPIATHRETQETTHKVGVTLISTHSSNPRFHVTHTVMDGSSTEEWDILRNILRVTHVTTLMATL